MKIVDNNLISNAALSQTGRTSGPEPSTSSSKGAGVKPADVDPDGLQLSSLAGSISKAVDTDSSARAEKLSQLTAVVQSGAYKVDSAAVSKAIVEASISKDANSQ